LRTPDLWVEHPRVTTDPRPGLEVLRPAGPPCRNFNHPSEVARRHLQRLSRRPDTPGSWSRTPGARPDRSLPPDPPVVETSAHSMRHSTTGTGVAPAPSANARLNGRRQLSAGQVRGRADDRITSASAHQCRLMGKASGQRRRRPRAELIGHDASTRPGRHIPSS